MTLKHLAILSLFFPSILATIIDDFSCTNTTSGTYLFSATSCTNAANDDAACERGLMYLSPEPFVLPQPGGNDPRPSYCYTPNGPGGAINEEMKLFSLNSCAKTCGYCCLTPEYTSCLNRPRPRINCESLTAAMCKDPTWHAIILSECPATCGLCGELMCIDRVTTCTVELCQRDPVHATKNCKKTCGLC